MPLALRSRDEFALARERLTWDRRATFEPAFEVKETTDAFVLRADVPGVAEAALDIAVHQRVLTVAGHRAADPRQDGETYALFERPFGAFTRSFALPATADGERVDAQLADGVLTLTIGKTSGAKPRRIAIHK